MIDGILEDDAKREKLMTMAAQLQEFLDEVVGPGTSMVLLVHPAHEPGECRGTAMFTSSQLNTVEHMIGYGAMYVDRIKQGMLRDPSQKLN